MEGEAGSSHVPGCAVTAVDTTAAGDAFNGALAVEGIAERSALASHTGGGGVVRGR
jgi:sugar/nucleoside kinase (ribokinase family)